MLKKGSVKNRQGSFRCLTGVEKVPRRAWMGYFFFLGGGGGSASPASRSNASRSDALEGEITSRPVLRSISTRAFRATRPPLDATR